IIGLTIELLILVVFGTAPAFFVALVANFAMNFGFSFVETAVNVMPTLTESERSAHSAMNLVHMSFSLGAFVGPLLIGIYLGATGEWRPIMFFAMIPTGLLLLWTPAVRFPRRVPAVAHSANPFFHLASVLKLRYAVLGSLTLLFYVGAEVSISSWVVYYLQKQLGLGAVASASGLSILWLFILIGRYLNSVLGNRYSSLALVAGSGVGGAIGVVAFLFARSIVPAYILLGWIGLCLAGGFPNVMAELNNRDPEKTGTVTAVIVTGAAIGAGVFQWFVGYLAETVSLTAAFVTPAVLQLLVVGSFAGALGRGAWRRKLTR
ncbi:MAG: MFS transporter, partial [Spirochaetia bacterium]